MERFAAGDEARLIEVWHNAAILAYNAGRLDDAQALLERVAALQSARAMTVDHARTAMNLAAIALARRDWDGAEQRLAAIAHVDHSRNEAVFVARNRAYAAAMRGEFDAARAFAADAVRRCADPAVGAEWRVEVQHVLGIIAYQAGEPYEAIRRQQLALLAAPRPPFRLAALPLEHAALAAAEIGQTAEAAQVLGYVDARRDRARLHRSPEFETFFGELRSRLGRLLGARLAEHTRVGASLAPERAAEIVFSLPTERPPGGGLAGLSDRERRSRSLNPASPPPGGGSEDDTRRISSGAGMRDTAYARRDAREQAPGSASAVRRRTSRTPANGPAARGARQAQPSTCAASAAVRSPPAASAACSSGSAARGRGAAGNPRAWRDRLVRLAGLGAAMPSTCWTSTRHSAPTAVAPHGVRGERARRVNSPRVGKRTRG